MKINTAIIIAFLVLLLGFFFGKPYLWIPSSILAAGLIDLLTRRWVISNKLGTARNLSILLKFLFTLIGFYATLGQIACVGLVFWWFVFK